MAAFTTNLRRVNAHNLHTLRTNPLAELSGALGDLGTLLPLLIALTLTGSISLSATLVFSGLANIATGVIFGIPLPVQPMKAIAAVAISQNYTIKQNMAAGLVTGGIITLFSITGLLRWFGRVVPVPVVRGIQVGAGLALVISAGTSLLKPLGWLSPTWADNWIWAIAAFLFLLLCSTGPRVPYALIVFLLGLTLAFTQLSSSSPTHSSTAPRFWHPHLYIPSLPTLRTSAIEASLPQLPLTTLNSILAVTSLSLTLFPSFPTAPSTTALGLSVGATNLLACLFGAMPICHGSGGLAAQYRFGARSGASIIVLGLVKLLLGLLAGEAVMPVLQRFPHALLGVMVLAAGVELAKVGQSLDDAGAESGAAAGPGDLWTEAARENGGVLEAADGERDKRRGGGSERERKDRWAVMLVTVAGCLAFKNDAVGFVAGMVWHWGLRVRDWWARRGGGGAVSFDGGRRLTRFWTARGDGGEVGGPRERYRDDVEDGDGEGEGEGERRR